MQCPHPTPQDQATPVMNPNSADMGVLVNDAEGKAKEESAKHPGELVKWGAAMDAAIWESLMTQVRAQLNNMTTDECYSRALELQMLARLEAGNRSERLSNDMDLMTTGQPVLQPPNGCGYYTPGIFIPISPMKPSRKSSNALKPAKYHVHYPSRQFLGDTKSSSPLKSDPSVKTSYP